MRYTNILGDSEYCSLQFTKGLSPIIPNWVSIHYKYNVRYAKRYIMQIKLFLLLGFIFVPMVGLAGWFDPDNYEDCVLEKMKGQDRGLISTARKACRYQFPKEIELQGQWGNVDIMWKWSDSSLIAEITRNDSEYEVTRFKAIFSTVPCDKQKSPSDHLLTKTFVFSKGGKIFDFTGEQNIASVIVDNVSQYKCRTSLTLWGQLRN